MVVQGICEKLGVGHDVTSVEQELLAILGEKPLDMDKVLLKKFHLA